MEILAIGIIVAAIVFIGYAIGKNQSNTAATINNEQVLHERDLINEEIKSQKEILDNLKFEAKDRHWQLAQEKQNLYNIQQQVQEKQAFIDSAKERAEKNYNDWEQAYAEKIQETMKDYQAQLIVAQEAVQSVRDNLESLKQQQAATIEAFQREEALKEEADAYKLALSEIDKADIEFLQSIKNRISKPRVLSMLIWQTYVQPLAKKQFPIILGSKEVCGIYKITNINNQMCYIGQARDCYKRFSQHCKCACGIDCPQGNKLYQAMQKYGIDAFTFELLEVCKPEELNEKEKYYIELYNSVSFGYNAVEGHK